jgi:biopolymer transport protein ExbD
MDQDVSSRSTSLLGYGLYFIDVLACLLFCVTLALVGARFGREQTVPLELPRMEAGVAAGADLSALQVSVRSRGGIPEFFVEDQPVSLAELETRLRSAPPPSIVLRSEESALARVIAVAHAAGVHDIELAYETGAGRRSDR